MTLSSSNCSGAVDVDVLDVDVEFDVLADVLDVDVVPLLPRLRMFAVMALLGRLKIWLLLMLSLLSLSLLSLSFFEKNCCHFPHYE